MAPENTTGAPADTAAQPVLPGDAARKAAEPDAPLTGSGAPSSDKGDDRLVPGIPDAETVPGAPGSTPGGGLIEDDVQGVGPGDISTAPKADEVDEEEAGERPEPTILNAGVEQDNVSEPGVQTTKTADGETSHGPDDLTDERVTNEDEEPAPTEEAALDA